MAAMVINDLLKGDAALIFSWKTILTDAHESCFLLEFYDSLYKYV